jgi:hypothetical protein
MSAVRRPFSNALRSLISFNQALRRSSQIKRNSKGVFNVSLTISDYGRATAGPAQQLEKGASSKMESRIPTLIALVAWSELMWVLVLKV